MSVERDLRAELECLVRPIPDEIEIIPDFGADDDPAAEPEAEPGPEPGAEPEPERAPGPTPEALGLPSPGIDLLPRRRRWWQRARRDTDPPLSRRDRRRRRGRDAHREAPYDARDVAPSPAPEPDGETARDERAAPAPRRDGRPDLSGFRHETITRPAPRPRRSRASGVGDVVEPEPAALSRAQARRVRRERRVARRRSRRRRWAVRRVCTALVVLALGIPVALADVVLKPHRVAAQVDTPLQPIAPDERSLYSAFASNVTQKQPVIISYHDIRPRPKDRHDPYTVTPTAFAREMAMLDEAGFTTLDARGVLDWLAGRPIPPRSVWITFDDAPKGLWIYADPILARHRFHATVFTITGVVGTHQPYYLNWDELRRLSRSGRWDVEAHTRLGHWRVPVDAKGDTGPFLVNRRWLPRENRLETIDEWDRRVTEDLRRSRDDIVRHGFPMPVFFAYPFSAVTFPTNDPRIPPLLEQRTRELFKMSVVNAENAGLVTRRDVANRLLPRVEVLGETTARSLFDHVAMWDPLEVAKLHPFDEAQRWVDGGGHPVPAAAFNGDSLRLPNDDRYASTFFAPGRLANWTDYRTTVHVSGLGAPSSGTSGSLHVLSGSDGEYAVSVSAGWVRILRGRTSQQALVLDRAIERGDAHDVTVATEQGHVTVSIDGVEVYSGVEPNTQLGLPAGGVGVSVYRARPESPEPVFSGIRIEPTAPATGEDNA